MSNGVMVAQQVLVLFVVVRIRLGQQKAKHSTVSRLAFIDEFKLSLQYKYFISNNFGDLWKMLYFAVT